MQGTLNCVPSEAKLKQICACHCWNKEWTHPYWQVTCIARVRPALVLWNPPTCNTLLRTRFFCATQREHEHMIDSRQHAKSRCIRYKVTPRQSVSASTNSWWLASGLVVPHFYHGCLCPSMKPSWQSFLSSHSCACDTPIKHKVIWSSKCCLHFNGSSTKCSSLHFAMPIYTIYSSQCWRTSTIPSSRFPTTKWLRCFHQPVKVSVRSHVTKLTTVASIHWKRKWKLFTHSLYLPHNISFVSFLAGEFLSLLHPSCCMSSLSPSQLIEGSKDGNKVVPWTDIRWEKLARWQKTP